MRILAGKVKVATPTDQLTSTEPTSHELLKLAHALFLKLAAEGLDKAELRGFIKRRYGKPTKFAMTLQELEDLLRLLKLYGPAICSRVTGEFNPPTQIPLDHVGFFCVVATHVARLNQNRSQRPKFVGSLAALQRKSCSIFMRWRSLCVSPNALWRFIQKSPIIFGRTCIHPIYACLI
ncbi:hypothetical protein [Laspinema olomoucense]|uniref:Uncharacterized protein n=1 Tax=Laspinema olomoucense D3b TaxID=2953688 RepID=A0ABT2NGA1_9CYAN|nr:hypothetical protein [Laspinema sp. D3b]MCT7981572.1 hypothetical protein [Laspinema sp. D3b]